MIHINLQMPSVCGRKGINVFGDSVRAVSKLYLWALILCGLLGCGKSQVPSLDDLLRKSSVIYVAHEKNGAYYVKQVLKSTPESRALYQEGQAVILNRQLMGHKPKFDVPVVVFYDKVVFDEKKVPRFYQTEVPLNPDGKLAYYGTTFQSLLVSLEVGPTRQP